jgi:uncharacterized protein (DUF849 family)
MAMTCTCAVCGAEWSAARADQLPRVLSTAAELAQACIVEASRV